MTTAEVQALVDKVHRDATFSSVADTTNFLQRLLTRRLVAYIAGVKDVKTVSRWANGEVETVRQESEQRLRTAYEIALLLTVFDSPQVIRAWFIGLNPQLGDLSPADALHDDRRQEALAAARAFVTGG
jgi:hypothetical protein